MQTKWKESVDMIGAAARHLLRFVFSIHGFQTTVLSEPLFPMTIPRFHRSSSRRDGAEMRMVPSDLKRCAPRSSLWYAITENFSSGRTARRSTDILLPIIIAQSSSIILRLGQILRYSVDSGLFGTLVASRAWEPHRSDRVWDGSRESGARRFA
jgi:hypothetical protein